MDEELKQLEDKFYSTKGVDVINPISNIVGSKPWYMKYLLYICLLVWTVFLLIIAKPDTMYVKDPETKEKKLKFSKIVMTFVTVFLSLSLICLGVTYYKKL